eukprot:15296305-Ditylum_brightwellii.AAC.1
MDTIIDVRLTNLDANSYLFRMVKRHLEAHEKEENDEYLKLCIKQRKRFTPLVCTVDVVLAHEKGMTLKQIAQVFAQK